MSINQIIDEKFKMLLKSGINSSRFEIKMLIGHILGVEPKALSLNMKMDNEQIEQLNQMIQQRLNHCPVDKIIGQKGFYKYDFAVNQDVLSPRADTEVLVEKAIELLKDKKKPRVLELGVGSGCIILSILADIISAEGVGIDISERALAISKVNAEKLNVKNNRLTLFKASWFDVDIKDKLNQYGGFDMIVSNPPYIPTDEINILESEVKDFDPVIALDGGFDGLKDYDCILDLAQNILKSDGIILLEASDGKQLDLISKKALQRKMQPLEILKDLNGIERCIILKK